MRKNQISSYTRRHPNRYMRAKLEGYYRTRRRKTDIFEQSTKSRMEPIMLNGKELKDCSDDELLNAWLDGIDMVLARAIVSEVKLRREWRTFQEPQDKFPI